MFICTNVDYNVYNWTFLANAIQINITADSDIIAKGQNLSLKCTVNTFFENVLTFDWKRTDKQKLKVYYLFNNTIFKIETS